MFLGTNYEGLISPEFICANGEDSANGESFVSLFLTH